MSEDTLTQPAAAPVTPAAAPATAPVAAEGAAPSDSGAIRVPMQRVPRFKKKICRFCHSKDLVIDYKKIDVLERFITDRGKILPRRITGTCAKHQRSLAQEIKRARMIALLPFVEM